MPLRFENKTSEATQLTLLAEDAVADWLAKQGDEVTTWCERHGFKGAVGQGLLLPGGQKAVVGYGSAAKRTRARFHLAAGMATLPAGTYALQTELDQDSLETECLGWLLSTYRFDRYASQSKPSARLIAPDDIDAQRLETIAAGEALSRDLINTPAADMGPPDLELAARDLAEMHDAEITVIEGDALLDQNFPMIHTVGRAADRPPRLIDMRWGNAGPTLTLVGKGVCFDTGGLNLKPASSMGLMKKDMGGAAAVLGLASMIMGTGQRLRLRVLVAAVENSVAGNAYRPQDILNSRKGLTVEINNTDAEGRLVLADALALADEETPDLIVSMATLTGAARVAVGPDLAPFYTDQSNHAQKLEPAAEVVADQVWRMPFPYPYETLIEPGIANLDNAPKGGFAGSITAALFLRRFVTDSPAYMHFDIYGWQPHAAPGRPKGGVGQGTRALLAALPDILSL